jgi:hypothetical protein
MTPMGDTLGCMVPLASGGYVHTAEIVRGIDVFVSILENPAAIPAELQERKERMLRACAALKVELRLLHFVLNRDVRRKTIERLQQEIDRLRAEDAEVEVL